MGVNPCQQQFPPLRGRVGLTPLERLYPGPVTVTGAPRTRRSALWASDRRATTTGLVILVTIAAFEALAVNTALPTIARDLHGGAFYSWVFTAMLAASVVGTVLSGTLSDRYGPAPGLLAGPVFFLAGLLVAGFAPTMPVLLAGRVLQGFGAGAQIVALYVLIAAVYPVGDRPAAFGALSAAWVVPGLVGPALAGFVTQQFGWRWIFLGLAPLPLLAMLLLIGVALRAHGGRRGGDEPQRPGLPLAALGAAAGLSAVTWAAQHPASGWLALGLAIGGLVVLAPALRRLLPAGTLAARPGIPVSVLARGLLAGAFFGVQAYLPLTLTAVHGYSPTEAGLPLTLAAVGWAVASNTQKRLAGIPKGVIVRWAFLGLAPALATLSLIATPWGPAWLAAPLWGLAGVAMGLGYPAVNLLVLELSPANERGFNAAALQIADMLGSATLIGFGGALFAAFASTERPTTAVVPFNLLMGAVALTGAALFARR